MNKLKNKFAKANEFYVCLTDTSRPPRVLEENGNNYWFIDREEMDEEIRLNNFLEHGEHNGNLYGTHLDSIRDVIKQGNTICVCPTFRLPYNFTNNFIASNIL